MKLFALLLSISFALSASALQLRKSTLRPITATAMPSTAPSVTFSNSGLVSNVQMTGTVTRTYGSDQETGTAILQAAANGQSRIELHLTNGVLVETQSASTPYEGQCTVSSFDGVAKTAAPENCWRGTVWFLPQIVLQPGTGWADNAVSATAVPTGTTVLHYFRKPAGEMSPETAQVIARLSQFDLTLDVNGNATVLSFNAHPDDNSSIDIPTEIHFADYRVVNGASVPFHIQKFINGGLVLDIQVSDVQINPTAAATGAL